MKKQPSKLFGHPLHIFYAVACSISFLGCRVSETGESSDSAIAQATEEILEEPDVAVVAISQKSAQANPIDDARAYGYLRQICQIGRRPSGSPGMAAQQELLNKHFSKLGGQVRLQRFRIKHPRSGQPVPVANLIVQWHPEAKRRILLCAHYDTRPLPDRDSDPRRREQGTFIGANDGASGTALLMELAHFMPKLESRYGVDFLLVDAEEFVFGYGSGHRYFIGSEYFSRDYTTNPPDYRYVKGAVLDMIGDARLQIYQDRNSVWWRDTRPVTQEIWSTAKRLGINEFIGRTHPRMREPIEDDHIMLHNVGRIPTCEIIDFDYPKYPSNRYWHTEADTPDKCSGASLAKVGWVILEWLATAE